MHIGKNYRYTGTCRHRLYTDLYLHTELGHVFSLLFSQQCEKYMDNYFAPHKKTGSLVPYMGGPRFHPDVFRYSKWFTWTSVILFAV